MRDFPFNRGPDGVCRSAHLVAPTVPAPIRYCRLSQGFPAPFFHAFPRKAVPASLRCLRQLARLAWPGSRCSTEPSLPASLLIGQLYWGRAVRGDIRRVLAMGAGCVLAAMATSGPFSKLADPDAAVSQDEARDRKLEVYVEAYVTGYNTVPHQTDDWPCISASGQNICGRPDVIACPRFLKFGTIVEVSGKRYVCEDRTARKYNHRFDINCDKDKNCPYQVAGWKSVKVLLE